VSATRRYAIAVIPGDGIGREVAPAALEVLEAAGRAHGFELRLTEHGACSSRSAAPSGST
jgi:tartrate dehydrogenase/decarboxylase / D-malate dehydrogenase